MNGIAHRFYEALGRADHATMNACYHEAARFHDPVFGDLDAAQVRAMWRMLLSRSNDLRAAFSVLREDGDGAEVRVEAWYTFTATSRPVHNIIHARMRFRDGLIVHHVDRFSFWRWSRQALGPMGLLLGWTPLVQGKVQRTAAASLRKAMMS